MTWGAVGGAAVGVIGGLLGSKSSNKAAQQQAQAGKDAAAASLQASREANALTADMYRQGMTNQSPYLQSGQVALSALMSGMGLGGAQTAYRAPGPSGDVGGTGGMAPIGSYVNAQGVAVDAKGKPITNMSSGLGGVNYGATQEEMNAGAAAVPAGTFQETYTGQDIYQDPSYQWRLEEGQRALRAQQAAGGNRWGGQAMKDITNYAQGAASQEFGAANERFLKNKALLYDRLSGLAGVGSSTAGTAATTGMNAANTMGQNTMTGVGNSNSYLTSAAASKAAGTVGSTQNLVSGVNSGLNNYMTMQYLRGNNNSSNNNIWAPGYGSGADGGWTGDH